MAETLSRLGFSPRLKWPNDVLLDTPEGLRKVAGILAEMSSESNRVRHVVLGVGINVNGADFPAPLAQVATSLALVARNTVDRCLVLATLLNTFEPVYDKFLAHGPASGLASWNRHAILGQRAWVERASGRIEGVAFAVDESGALLLRTDPGETAMVHAGEVNWL